MSNVSIFRVNDYRDPKLGIKSSMPGLKEGIAWLILFHLVTKDRSNNERVIKPFEEYADQNNKTRIRLTEEIKSQIIDLFQNAGIDNLHELDILQNAFNKCTLLSTQMEPIIVAFEIFLQLAECEFDSTTKRPKSAERTGGERFGKSFKLTSAVRRLAAPFDIAIKPFLYLMLEWITLSEFEISDSVKKTMKIINSQICEQILDLSSRTIFRFEDENPGKPDHYFNTLGLYNALLAGRTVKLAKNREDKGPLRILKNAIQSGLLPGLVFAQNEFRFDEKTSYRYVRMLIEELKNYETLSMIDFFEERQSPRTGTEETQKSSHSSHNVILYGVPGSGKSYRINQDHVSKGDYVGRVVFHPDYMYANFIGQILPVVSSGEVKYEFVPGPFTEILQKSIENPKQRHVLIIEEINRGNAAAIFGDVFQLLDRDESGASRYGIRNRDLSQLIYGNVDSEITIPSNLVLLATMNTSDQNIFTLDTAFQRRWSMENVPNDLTKVPWANMPIAGTAVTWEKFITEINRLIITGSDSLVSSEDKRIGAFFATEKELLIDSTRVFAEKVLKYLWDDPFKFNRSRIFIDAESRTLEDVIYAFVSAPPQKRWDAVFTSTLVTQLLPVEVMIEQSDNGKLKLDSLSDGAK